MLGVQIQHLGRFFSDGHKELEMWTKGEDSKQSLLEKSQSFQLNKWVYSGYQNGP